MIKMRVIGSTKPNYEIPMEEAKEFCGKLAGICYMKESYDLIEQEPTEVSLKRYNGTLKTGHHSTSDPITYNLLLENIPKIIAMIINNEKDYGTLEKSARYTVMKTEGIEAELYEKWMAIFRSRIKEQYPSIEDDRVTRLAQENARYITSIFTPATMEYKVTLRQLNYISAMMEDFIAEKSEETDNFTARLIESMKEFLDQVSRLRIEKLDGRLKSRKLSLFDTAKGLPPMKFDETYCTNYTGTLAQLAQAQRHRTLDYKIRHNFSDPTQLEFFIPEIIRPGVTGDFALCEAWLSDLKKVAHLIPQATMVWIKERGTYEAFMLKCMERLCGSAQLEITRQTTETLAKYMHYAPKDSGIYEEFINAGFGIKPRCKFPNFKCALPCIWGPDKAFERRI